MGKSTHILENARDGLHDEHGPASPDYHNDQKNDPNRTLVYLPEIIRELVRDQPEYHGKATDNAACRARIRRLLGRHGHDIICELDLLSTTPTPTRAASAVRAPHIVRAHRTLRTSPRPPDAFEATDSPSQARRPHPRPAGTPPSQPFCPAWAAPSPQRGRAARRSGKRKGSLAVSLLRTHCWFCLLMLHEACAVA